MSRLSKRINFYVTVNSSIELSKAVPVISLSSSIVHTPPTSISVAVVASKIPSCEGGPRREALTNCARIEPTRPLAVNVPTPIERTSVGNDSADRTSSYEVKYVEREEIVTYHIPATY